MNTDDFKVGDVVHLNSGSPPLTVSRLMVKGDITEAEVFWIAEGKAEMTRFDVRMLRKSGAG